MKHVFVIILISLLFDKESEVTNLKSYIAHHILSNNYLFLFIANLQNKPKRI